VADDCRSYSPQLDNASSVTSRRAADGGGAGDGDKSMLSSASRMQRPAVH